MRAKLLEIKETLYRMCHLPVPEQGRWLGQVVRGYFAYHAVPTNSRRTTFFAYHADWHRRRALMRRSQKAFVPWRRMKLIAARWIPSAGIRHPCRNNASSSNTRGGSRVRQQRMLGSV